MTKKKTLRNPIARILRYRQYRQQVVKNRRNYNRKSKDKKVVPLGIDKYNEEL